MDEPCTTLPVLWEETRMPTDQENGTKAINIRNIPIIDFAKAQELKARYGCSDWVEYLQVANKRLEEGLLTDGGKC